MLFTKFVIDTESSEKFMDVLLREHREDIKEMLQNIEHYPALRIAKTYHRRYYAITTVEHNGYQIGISYDKEEDTYLFFFQVIVNDYVNRIFCEIPEDFMRKSPIPYAIAKEG